MPGFFRVGMDTSKRQKVVHGDGDEDDETIGDTDAVIDFGIELPVLEDLIRTFGVEYPSGLSQAATKAQYLQEAGAGEFGLDEHYSDDDSSSDNQRLPHHVGKSVQATLLASKGAMADDRLHEARLRYEERVREHNVSKKRTRPPGKQAGKQAPPARQSAEMFNISAFDRDDVFHGYVGSPVQPGVVGPLGVYLMLAGQAPAEDVNNMLSARIGEKSHSTKMGNFRTRNIKKSTELQINKKEVGFLLYKASVLFAFFNGNTAESKDFLRGRRKEEELDIAYEALPRIRDQLKATWTKFIELAWFSTQPYDRRVELDKRNNITRVLYIAGLEKTKNYERDLQEEYQFSQHITGTQGRDDIDFIRNLTKQDLTDIIKMTSPHADKFLNVAQEVVTKHDRDVAEARRDDEYEFPALYLNPILQDLIDVCYLQTWKTGYVTQDGDGSTFDGSNAHTWQKVIEKYENAYNMARHAVIQQETLSNELLKTQFRAYRAITHIGYASACIQHIFMAWHNGQEPDTTVVQALHSLMDNTVVADVYTIQPRGPYVPMYEFVAYDRTLQYIKDNYLPRFQHHYTSTILPRYPLRRVADAMEEDVAESFMLRLRIT